MSRFNLEDYETVEQRIRRFYDMHPDGRIITDNLTTLQDRQVGTWVVKTTIYLTTGDQAEDLPKSTGHAFEVDGTGMANQTAALENAETSSIGRALANMNLSGNKRTSREEMAKVERGVTPKAPSRDWNAEIAALETVEGARQLWDEARTQKAPKAVQDEIKAKGQLLDTDAAMAK
ncbi:hypothetical protein UFOVP609_43 [uncultured Caudovirales phage]|uniref:Uncharacterized protein n=1 Tax=uncultured Caudovirales phage TaxID=2100421 RepID=A0A6J5N2Z2_9CAUD|nr:hypothetical protein UFOVP609_43 [uncultured Caudovirales phage]